MRVVRPCQNPALDGSALLAGSRRPGISAFNGYLSYACRVAFCIDNSRKLVNGHLALSRRRIASILGWKRAKGTLSVLCFNTLNFVNLAL